jgi:hypothetical protein
MKGENEAHDIMPRDIANTTRGEYDSKISVAVDSSTDDSQFNRASPCDSQPTTKKRLSLLFSTVGCNYYLLCRGGKQACVLEQPGLFYGRFF